MPFSTKNIAIATERNYKLQLIEKTELFIKKIQWKAVCYDMKLNNENKNNSKSTTPRKTTTITMVTVHESRIL